MKTYLLILLLAVAVVCGMGPTAKACDGGGWGDCGIGWLYQSLQYNVPYYAAFPPVYYSYPVPRTYGYSPFAYPPGVMTPEVMMEAQPLTINNPFVPSTQEKPAAKSIDRAASVSSQPQPLVINNPYVTPGKSLARSGS